MTRFFSKTTNSFYDDSINSDMPGDAVQVGDDLYNFCFAAQSNGGSITSDRQGNPVAVASTVSYERADILRQILVMENDITPRRRDEAILGIDDGWLAAKREQITALRETLPSF